MSSNNLVKEKGIFLFDIEGVIYRGRGTLEPIQSAIDYVNFLKSVGKEVRFISNATVKNREMVYETLKKLGVTVSLEDIFMVGALTAEYIQRKYGKCKCMVIGSDVFKADLEKAGITITDSEDCDLVVVAYEKVSYDKLNSATRALLNGADLIAAHMDRVTSSSSGVIMSSGCFVKALEYAANKKAKVSIGKPSSFFFKRVLGSFSPSEAVMIGDYIDGDIVGANKNHLSSVLVLTGTSSRGDAEKAKGVRKPDIVVDSLKELMKGGYFNKK